MKTIINQRDVSTLTVTQHGTLVRDRFRADSTLTFHTNGTETHSSLLPAPALPEPVKPVAKPDWLGREYNPPQITEEWQDVLLKCYIDYPEKVGKVWQFLDLTRMCAAFAVDNLRNSVSELKVSEPAIWQCLLSKLEEDAHDDSDKARDERAQRVEFLRERLEEVDSVRELPFAVAHLAMWRLQHERRKAPNRLVEAWGDHEREPENPKKRAALQHALTLCSQVVTEITIPAAKRQSKPMSLTTLAEMEIDHSKTLLGNRWLCLGGGALFVGPSGVGKSSASIQQDVLWACGREAFGIRPPRPLRVLCIQAENDEGDLIEMARGVANGLELTVEERVLVYQNTVYIHHNQTCGDEFLVLLRKWIEEWQPDILRLDPLNAYVGGDITDMRIVSPFLRNGLNPMLAQYQCAALIACHTPKTNNRDTSKWRPSDWVYAMAGHAELSNWARAVIVIDPTDDPYIHKFIAAKRGRRLDWEDENDQVSTIRHFKHAAHNEGILWTEATAEEVANLAREKKSKERKVKETYCDEDFLECLVDGPLNFGAWQAQANLGCGVSKATFANRVKILMEAGIVVKTGKKYLQNTRSRGSDKTSKSN